MKKLIMITFILIGFVFSGLLFAQDAKKPAENLSMKLKQKVLLTDDQAAKVQSILTSYISLEKGKRDQNKYKTQIESLLDERQKAKYEIIKKDWWIEVDRQ